MSTAPSRRWRSGYMIIFMGGEAHALILRSPRRKPGSRCARKLDPGYRRMSGMDYCARPMPQRPSALAARASGGGAGVSGGLTDCRSTDARLGRR